MTLLAAEFSRAVLRWLAPGLLFGWVLALPLALYGQEENEPITFADHVQPIFRQRCAACHHPDKKSGGLDLTNFTAIMLGGSSGEVIDPGDADGSYLYMLVTHEEEPVMPPNSAKLPADELRIIKQWINQGALETKTSKSNIKRRSLNLSVSGSATERPERVAVPPRLPLEPVRETELPPTAVPLAVSPWASLVAIGGTEQVLLYDVARLELVGILPFPEGRPRVLRFSRSGQIVLAGGGTDALRGRVVWWDVATGRRIAEIGDELDTVLAADISADHRLVVLAGPQKVVRVYRVADGALMYECRKHTDWVTAASFSPDGVLLATGDRGGNVFVWESLTGNEYLTLRGHTQMINELTWRWDSNLLASVSEDSSIRWWELENGGQVKNISAHGGGATWGVFGRDGAMFSTGRDQLVRLWNVAGDPQSQFAGAADITTCVGICQESQRVIASDWRGNVWVWNVTEGTLLGQLPANPPSLARRLKWAEEARNDMSALLAAAESRFQTAEAEYQTARAALAKATEQLSQHEAAITNIEQALSAKQSVLATKQEEQQAWGVELAEKSALLPNLEELAAKSQEVADLSPHDRELVDTSRQLAEKVARTRARIEELARLSVEVLSAQSELTNQIQQLEQQLASARQERDQANLLVAEMQSIFDARQADVALRQTERDAAKQRWEQSELAVQRWQDEIAFVAELHRLQEQMAAAERQTVERLQARDALAEEVRAAQSRLAEAEQAVREAEDAARAIQQAIDRLQRIE